VSSTQSTELLAAVRHFLRAEILPDMDGFKAYNIRVAANALGIVAREIESGAGLATLDTEIATALNLDEQAGPIARQIAVGLRDGTLTVSDTVFAYLKKRTLLAISIDNPKYSGLLQARERWGD
jgi:hypothetical protein